MEILFLTRRFYPEIGGVEKHVFKVSEELIKLGHNITIITEVSKKIDKKNYQTSNHSARSTTKQKQPVKSSYFEYYMAEKLRVIYFEGGGNDWFKKFRIWAWFLKNISLVKNFDVVHCHDVFFWYLPLRFIFPSKKVFTTFHGYESYPLKRKNVIIRKASEVLSSGNICVGEFMKKWYKAKPDYIIYGGVDIPKRNTVVKKPSALFVGRLDEQTNALDYFKAVRKLKEKYPAFDFVIAGDGRYRWQGEKVGKVLGFIDIPENLFTEYRFAFVSRYLAILEAMVAKRAVFALYDNPLKRDYLEMTPFRKYINIVNNYQDLASIVKLFCSGNKIEHNQVNKAYLWTKKQTWKNIAKIYLKLWEK